MYLLYGVLVEVQASCCVVHQQLVFVSFLAVVERQITRHQPWEYIEVNLLSITTAILLRWWQMMACSKDASLAVDLGGRPLIGRKNNAADMAILLTPFLNLRRDSIAPAGTM